MSDALKVRNVLQVPVPEIYAWNSEASTNSVGAEYIIMEKAPGVELSRVWPELRGDERGKILKQIIQFQKRFTASPFPSLGSLYYADSLDKSLKAFPVERGALESVPHPKDFVVGPINDERFFEEGRGDIECDRGPCTLFIPSCCFRTADDVPRVMYARLLSGAWPPRAQLREKRQKAPASRHIWWPKLVHAFNCRKTRSLGRLPQDC